MDRFSLEHARRLIVPDLGKYYIRPIGRAGTFPGRIYPGINLCIRFPIWEIHARICK
jgi:hypothetical protein